MFVSDYVKMFCGAVVATMCLGAVAVASKPVTTSASLTPKVNPATEFKSYTWLTANTEVQHIKPPAAVRVVRGSRIKEKIIALTFDDAPRPETTEALMLILQGADVPATFFVIGKQVERYPTVTREIDANGFTIGNHTYSHVNLKEVPLVDVETEYAATNNAVRGLVGHDLTFCRPPGGDCNLKVEEGAAAVGLKTVLWTDDPADYAMPGEQVILDYTLSHLSDGGIILLHDGVQQTVDILPKLIHDIRARGYRIVPLSDLPSQKV
ncbi:MAG: polysaccharide deacetylase family protein [Fimbriimonadaceae bacterium]